MKSKISESSKASFRFLPSHCASLYFFPALILIITFIVAVIVFYTYNSGREMFVENWRREERLRMREIGDEIDNETKLIFYNLNHLAWHWDELIGAASEVEDSVADLPSQFHEFGYEEIVVIEPESGSQEYNIYIMKEESNYQPVRVESSLTEFENGRFLAEMYTVKKRGREKAYISYGNTHKLTQNLSEPIEGVWCIVPAFEKGDRQGLIAAMITMNDIYDYLRGSFQGNASFIVGEDSVVFGGDLIPTDLLEYLSGQFSAGGIEEFFAAREDSESFNRSGWTALWRPLRLEDGRARWLVYLYKESSVFGQMLALPALGMYGTVASILFAGFILALLQYILNRRFLEQKQYVRDLKQAQEALRESETQYRLLAENVIDVIWMVDNDLNFTYLSPSAEKISGYRIAELKAMDLKQLLTPASFETAMEAFQEDLEGLQQHQKIRQTRTMELEIARKDGSTLWTESIITFLQSEDGRPAGYQGITRDITLRKQFERALEEQIQFLQVLIDSIPVPIFYKDLNGTYVNCNEAMAQAYGGTKEEIIGKRIQDIMIPSVERLISEKDDELFRTQCGQKVECEFINKKGQKKNIILYRAPYFRDDGSLAGLVGAALDITERKLMEAEQERLSTAVKQAGESILITDANGVIQYVNPAFEKISGYSSKEAVGQNPRILKSGKQKDKTYREMWQTITRGKIWRGRFVNKRKDGTLYEEEAMISPVRDKRGQIVNYVAVKRDISNEVELERQLRQAQKLEAVGQLAGGIAHDFNNLLQAIQGYADIALINAKNKKDNNEAIVEIQKAADRAAVLTRQLLAFSRQQVLQPQTLDLNHVISDVMKMLRPLLSADIELEFHLQPHLGKVNADPGQIEQILINLCINSRDAMKNGGCITVETGEISYDNLDAKARPEAYKGDFVLLKVTDNGEGIEPVLIDRIFDPFFTTKETGKGTGLGLSTVYGIVKQHDGMIEVESEVGKGTTFRIMLPKFMDATQPRPRKSSAPAIENGVETILIAEDDSDVHSFLVHVLEQAGYEVLAATNGEEAVDLYEQNHNRIDLAILDAMMPGISGWEAFERIKDIDPDAKVIFCSGYSPASEPLQFIVRDNLNFIQKPFRPAQLLHQIRKLLVDPELAGEAGSR